MELKSDASAKGNISGDKIDKLKQFADTQEGKKIQEMFKGSELEQAVKNGDMESLKDAVTQLLQTDAGARLAQKISEMMK